MRVPLVLTEGTSGVLVLEPGTLRQVLARAGQPAAQAVLVCEARNAAGRATMEVRVGGELRGVKTL